MVKTFFVIVSLFFFILSFFVIYSARNIMKNRVSKENENAAVSGLKSFGYVMCIASLVAIYILK